MAAGTAWTVSYDAQPVSLRFDFRRSSAWLARVKAVLDPYVLRT